MRYLKYALAVGIFAVLATAGASKANAQVAVQFGYGGPGYYGPAPVCTYGYYDYYPYACAPYGFYGPDYFVDGVFIGAGPWFRGYPRGYYGGGFYRGREFRGGFRDRGFRDRDFRGGSNFRGGSGFRGGTQFNGGGNFRSGGGNFRGGGGFRSNGGSSRGGGSHGGGRR
jgi:hypothetical protein